MTMKAEQDLLESLEREIEKFHELRERCGKVSQLSRWPMLGCPSGPEAESPAADPANPPA